MSLTDALAIVALALGVVVAVVGVAIAHAPVGSLTVMLELWTGAGLLRLSAAATWTNLAVAAAIIVIRKIVLAQIRHAALS